MLKMKRNATVKLEIEVGSNKAMTENEFNSKIAEKLNTMELLGNSIGDLRFHFRWRNEDDFIVDKDEAN